jgi:hypothetical protein
VLWWGTVRVEWGGWGSHAGGGRVQRRSWAGRQARPPPRPDLAPCARRPSRCATPPTTR